MPEPVVTFPALSDTTIEGGPQAEVARLEPSAVAKLFSLTGKGGEGAFKESYKSMTLSGFVAVKLLAGKGYEGRTCWQSPSQSAIMCAT